MPALKLNHDLSLPGRPQNNSLAERTNQFMFIIHAGLPTCYWVQAITTLCHLMNVEEVNGSSAWLRMHGEEFKGEKIPFGALVDFKPSEARGEKREKFEPRGETGMFAGYVLSTGMHWANKYAEVQFNETLEGIEMSVDAIGLDARDRLIEDEDYEPELLQSDEKQKRTLTTRLHG